MFQTIGKLNRLKIEDTLIYIIEHDHDCSYFKSRINCPVLNPNVISSIHDCHVYVLRAQEMAHILLNNYCKLVLSYFNLEIREEIPNFS